MDCRALWAHLWLHVGCTAVFFFNFLIQLDRNYFRFGGKGLSMPTFLVVFCISCWNFGEGGGALDALMCLVIVHFHALIFFLPLIILLINTIRYTVIREKNLPFTMSPEYQAAQRAYQRYHNMNPIFGISSKWVGCLFDIPLTFSIYCMLFSNYHHFPFITQVCPCCRWGSLNILLPLWMFWGYRNERKARVLLVWFGSVIVCGKGPLQMCVGMRTNNNIIGEDFDCNLLIN